MDSSLIDNVLLEMRTDRVTVRLKAFNRLNEMLQGRLSDVQQLISNDDDFSWEGIFRAAHEGTVSHAQKLHVSSTELCDTDPKIAGYSRALLKICESPQNESSGIPYNFMMIKIYEVLTNEGCIKYFGNCYLKILRDSVLKPKNNLTSIPFETWKNILEILFKLMRSKRHQLNFMELLQCTKLVVDLGCSFSHLASELNKYLDVLVKLLEKRTVEREKLELLLIAYHCCRHIAVDYRFEVCRFTETIAKNIKEVFKVDMNGEAKVILFKLMDLAVIVHYPNLAKDKIQNEYIADRNVWNCQLRNFLYMTGLELKLPPKSKYRGQRNPELSQVVAQFAARLCFLMHWDDSVWVEEEAGEASAKKVKQSDKLQAMMDLAQPSEDKSEFNWNWLTIIAEVIFNFPSALHDDDFQQLLKMLAFCQPSIEFSSQIYAFTKCCFVLLTRDASFSGHANIIIVNLCQELWHKIADGVLRVCTLNNKNSVDNHILLQTLIHHQKFSSSSFIEDVIKIFLDKSTIKCDTTLQTLIVLMKNFNLDSLPKGKDLAAKVLSYTFEKPLLSDLKKVITTAGSEKPTAKVMSQLGVICCLSKTDVINYAKNEKLEGDEIFEGNWKLQQQVEYKKEIDKITRLILLKVNERLLIEDNDFLGTGNVVKKPQEFPREIKCILDQSMYDDELKKVVEFKEKLISEDNDIDVIKEYLQQVMENNEMMMNLTDNFLRFEAFNAEKFRTSVTVKKLDFRMQEIERLFGLILMKQQGLELKETHQLLMLVKSLFSADYHREICLKVRSFELKNCLRWTAKQTKHKFNVFDDDAEPMSISATEFNAAKMEEKLKCHAVEALCMYNNFDGINVEYFVDRLKRIEELKIKDNFDLHTVFSIIKILAQQETILKEVVCWVWTFIVDICGKYHNHQYVSLRMIEALGDIVQISKQQPELTSNVVALFKSFAILCGNQQYNVEVSEEFVKQFKFFHQHFFNLFIDEDPVIATYKLIIDRFMNSESFAIRMATVKTISFVLYSDIEMVDEFMQMKAARNSKREIFKTLFKDHQIEMRQEDMEVDENDDVETNAMASSLQLFTSLFCVNFILRKPIIFEISKIMLRYNFNEDTALKIFNKMLAFLKCDAKSLMDSNSIENLLTQSINRGISLIKFPWFFTGAKSLKDFTDENYDLMSLAILKNKCRSLEEFADSVDISPKALLKDLMHNCFSHLLPIEAGCPGIKYETKAEEIKKKLDNYFTADQQKFELLRKISLVIGCVLENVLDRAKFTEICGFELEVHDSEEMINCASFDLCLAHLKTNYSTSSNQSLLKFFCNTANLCHFIEKLLLTSKRKIQSTSLKEHKLLYLLQYCVLVEKLFDYLTDAKVTYNIKGFIVRDVTNFLCFLVLDPSFGLRLRETAANFLSTFIKKILPVCAGDLKPFLNKLVSSLVSVCGRFELEFEKKCFEIIEFLIFHQGEALDDEIKNLDKFPDSVEFNKLQRKQLEVKYKNGTFTLEQEIEHFLKSNKRKVEGLVELRKHLAEKKSELKLLFDEISSTLGFSEDGENSLLHKLVRSLVSYARNLDNEERSVEAIKCLGEIGCYDLSTMVFISDEHHKTVYEKFENSAHCQQVICRQALDQMETMLLHHNPRIFESASNACYHMMESASAQGYKSSIYLRPFNTNTISRKNLFYDEPKRDKQLAFEATLSEGEFSTYKTWIKRVAGAMMLFAGDRTLEKVSSAQKSFAELMCQLMLQLLLSYDDPEVNDEIIAGINFFFLASAEKLNYEKVNEGSIFLSKLAIRQMLKLVECIRVYCRQNRKSNMAEKLELNFLNIAKAANHCEAFFTAVLYCELHAEANKSAINHKTFQEIMHRSMTAIGIEDATELFVNPMTKRSLYLQLAGQSWQNILEHDAAGSENYWELLNNVGLNTLANKLATVSGEKKPYECLWRLSNWDALIESDSELSPQEEFEKFHYAGLKCLKNGDELGLKTAVNKARKATLQLLQHESLECTQNLYKFLAKSQLLQQIEDFAEIRFTNLQELREKLMQKWNAQNELPQDFKLIEPVLSQRNSIFDTANIRMGSRTWIPEAMQSNMLQIVKESISAGCESDAVKMMAKMRTLSKLSVTSKAELLIKEAQLSCKTNVNLAKFCLRTLQEEQEFDREYLLRSVAYRMYGEIMAESHADDIGNISNDYFKKSVSYLEKYSKFHNRSHLVADVRYGSQESQGASQPQAMALEEDKTVDRKIKENICVFDIIAKYFDREYVARSDYIDSPDFENKKKAFENNKIKYAGFVRECSADMNNLELRKSCKILQKSLDIDENEINSVTKQKWKAAGNAMYYYLRGAMNDPNDNVLSIFRIISIWLANLDNELILKMLRESILKIPSYKFIVALPQLTVRLSDRNDENSNQLLMMLLEKCSVDHPHHTLPLILALVNSYADGPENSQEEPRVLGAKFLWKKLKKLPQINSTMLEMEKMSLALISLANSNFSEMPTQVTQLKNLQHVQCPTIDIPVMRDCNYSRHVISVKQWLPKLENVGGINAPKKITCLCSDGVQRAQLLKGKDDMRQDAVMEQVFGVVNQLLRDNKETKKRHARIRTYKVVPFSRRSGILEWCNNTTPIGMYLAGERTTNKKKEKKGAHQIYYPDDWSPLECMNEVTKFDTADLAAKEKNFKRICDNIRPAFHHFFYENYKNPGQLFERRLAYTTSVAVSSMVGYILGIGDRHVQNILIDLNTAEVIHIDFGIAFEQGRILPHPELIPFRLTRDFVAPMGVCGVNGVFRKTCEKTMKILRQNEKTLTTILEVLLYDPMYAWTLTSKQAQRRQLETDEEDSNDDSTNQVERDSMASRALLKIQAKLKGQADDSTGYSSVEGQVECLIQKAMNPALLSRLFRGWQAYL